MGMTTIPVFFPLSSRFRDARPATIGCSATWSPTHSGWQLTVDLRVGWWEQSDLSRVAGALLALVWRQWSQRRLGRWALSSVCSTQPFNPFC